MEERGEGKLMFEDFVEVYRSELGEGKFWGVDYDLVQAIGTPMERPQRESFEATFDYIYCTTSTLQVHQSFSSPSSLLLPPPSSSSPSSLLLLFFLPSLLLSIMSQNQFTLHLIDHPPAAKCVRILLPG